VYILKEFGQNGVEMKKTTKYYEDDPIIS